MNSYDVADYVDRGPAPRSRRSVSKFPLPASTTDSASAQTPTHDSSACLSTWLHTGAAPAPGFRVRLCSVRHVLTINECVHFSLIAEKQEREHWYSQFTSGELAGVSVIHFTVCEGCHVHSTRLTGCQARRNRRGLLDSSAHPCAGSSTTRAITNVRF